MRISTPSLIARIAGTTALGLLTLTPAFAQDTPPCALVGGVLPAGCDAPNAGTVVSRPAQPNTADRAGETGDMGFSISIDPVTPEAAPVTIAGDAARTDRTRDMDRLLDRMGVSLSYDGLGARPALNVSTLTMRRSYGPGESVVFRSSSNYPAWITRSVVLVRDTDGRTLAAVPIAANGTADWQMPGDGADEMTYALRVYDAQGRYDETQSLPLLRGPASAGEPQDRAIIAAGEAEDRTARRGIPVRGGAVTVSGADVPAGSTITVMGEDVPVDAGGRFVMQRILPPGAHDVKVGVARQGSQGRTISRPVDIPRAEWFSTGIVDITIGRDQNTGDTWDRGRIAGYAEGVLADDTRITASVDTREDELRHLFDDFTRKHPDQMLAQIDPEDVFVTTGDDSVIEDRAPTSGKVYLKVEKDGSHLQWGDFRPTGAGAGLARSDRAMYGLQGQYVSPSVTAQGEPRIRVEGFAAQPDTLAQRDVFRGTGGSTYFLQRQDIQRGTQVVAVELRDPVSGRVLERRALYEGRDYRINAVQGVVILTRPLSPSATGGGLVEDAPLGDLVQNLVVQYEYVPTVGSVDGMSAGVRAEGWLTDHLRLGVSGVQETTGLADNRLRGADLLWRLSEGTEVSLDYARSEGPGFGNTSSLNGGLEFDPANPTAGINGTDAEAWSLHARIGLEDFGGSGHILMYADRKEAGFTSPDYDVTVTQEAYGVSGDVGLGQRARLTFGYDRFEDAAGKDRTDGRIGLAYAIRPDMEAEVEVALTDRTTPGSTLAEDNGTRTDLGVKLTWERDPGLTLWVFGQATLDRSGGMPENNRLGVGAEAQLTDALSARAEVSGGSLGAAAEAELAWTPNADSTYRFGYRLDPLRAHDSNTLRGRDRGTFVFGSDRRVNDQWTYTTEHTYSAFGSEPSAASTYGVAYTPSDRWRFDGGLILGSTTETDGTEVKREGLSFGMRYTDADLMRAGLRLEYVAEDSNNTTRANDRDTYLVSAFYERQTSADWRLLMNLDAVVSDSDQSSVRDGRYIEAKLGYAFRPVDNDRLNLLFSYTYLYDMPGADQVNIDGNINGPKQRSHILNAAASYELSPTFTLGAKYGYRLREEAARGSDTFTDSQAHLGVLRLDYHVVHNWDLMLEGRVLKNTTTDVSETGVLTGVYRHVGNNLKIGAGYNFGTVSDDLRTIDADREGVFLNVIGKF